MKVETQSSTQASSALRARSQTRPCCRASCTAGCTAGFTAAESQVSISQARYLRPCNRSIADWSHALSSEKSLTSRIQVQTSWEKLVKRRFQKPEPAKSLSQTPAKHVSTALQTFFAGWAMLGYSKISQKIAKCSKMSNKFQHQPSTLSTALQTSLRTGPLCGIRKKTWFSTRKLRNVHECRTNSSNVLYKCFRLAFENRLLK